MTRTILPDYCNENLNAASLDARLRFASSHRPKHDQHDWRRPLHYNPAIDGFHGRSTIHAGLADGRADSDFRRSDLERIGGGAASLVVLFLLCRQIKFLSKITVTLWVGTVLAMLAVIVTGLPHFNVHRALDFPSGAFAFNRGFVLGLGSATLIAVYNYLGYYDVCYIGDEVRNPSYVVPRSILYSLAICCVGYLALHLAIIGVVPWG